jgi:hypothetical protein
VTRLLDKTPWLIPAFLLFCPCAARGEATAAPGPPPAAAEAPSARPPPGAIEQIDAWLDKTKAPAPWLTWGADLRFRADYLDAANLNSRLPGHETSQQKYRPRWWSTLTPAKGVDVNARIIWEGRHNSEPHNLPTFVPNEVLIDVLNLRLTHPAGLPLTLTVGRQDIVLGDGWLVGDGTPLDGARTTFFDAVRLTLDLRDVQTIADLIYLDHDYDSDRWIPPLEGMPAPLMEQDERGFILWVANRSLKNTEVDGYYIYNVAQRVARNGDEAYLHTFGGRAAGDLGDRWRYRAEGAHQFGARNGRSLRAFGFTSAVTYLLKDAWKGQVRGTYEFLSGDDPDTRTNEAFVVPWGRYDRFSQILGTTWALETRKYEITNLHRLGPGFACHPTGAVELSGDYYLMFADENSMTGVTNRRSFSADGKFRGQMLQAQARWQMTRHLKSRILVEFFFPGNYYTDYRGDMATFLRGELYFTW